MSWGAKPYPDLAPFTALQTQSRHLGDYPCFNNHWETKKNIRNFDTPRIRKSKTSISWITSQTLLCIISKLRIFYLVYWIIDISVFRIFWLQFVSEIYKLRIYCENLFAQEVTSAIFWPSRLSLRNSRISLNIYFKIWRIVINFYKLEIVIIDMITKVSKVFRVL